MHRALLAALPLLALLGQAQEPQPPRPGADAVEAFLGRLEGVYPPVAHGKQVRFYSLKGDVDAGSVRSALLEFNGDLVRGPFASSARPGNLFVAVELEGTPDPKAVRKALAKGGTKVEELEWFAFDGRVGEQGASAFGMGFAGRDLVIGMASEVRWYETLGTYSQVYCVAGKMKAKELVDRYAKLYEPFGGGRLGSVRRDQLTWTLATAPDAERAKELAKEIGKLAGVAAVRLEGNVLELALDLAGLSASNPQPPLPEGLARAMSVAGADSFLRASFASDALHALLTARGFPPSAPAPTAPGASEPGPNGEGGVEF